MELAQEHIRCGDLVFEMLNLQILLPDLAILFLKLSYET
jgi:hypothetical protein